LPIDLLYKINNTDFNNYRFIYDQSSIKDTPEIFEPFPEIILTESEQNAVTLYQKGKYKESLNYVSIRNKISQATPDLFNYRMKLINTPKPKTRNGLVPEIKDTLIEKKQTIDEKKSSPSKKSIAFAFDLKSSDISTFRVLTGNITINFDNGIAFSVVENIKTLLTQNSIECAVKFEAQIINFSPTTNIKIPSSYLKKFSDFVENKCQEKINNLKNNRVAPFAPSIASCD
jgi:hypothetical protein